MTNHPRRILRRLAAADGYLDLDMPKQALEELDAVEDFGALEAPAEFLRGKALKRQERFSEAIPSLERAAQLIPAPFNRPVWMMLSECLRHDGQVEMADVAAALAEDAASELGETISMLTLEITLETEATRSFLRGLKSEEPSQNEEEDDLTFGEGSPNTDMDDMP